MQAGKLRERIRFESPVDVRDAIGGQTRSWSDAGDAWALVETLRGREMNVAQQIEAVVTLQVTTRVRDDVIATWRIKWGAKVLSIEAALPTPKRDFTVFLCSEGLNQSDL